MASRLRAAPAASALRRSSGAGGDVRNRAGKTRRARTEFAADAAPDAACVAAIGRIKDEHLALASVLYGLRQATERIRVCGVPDFRLLFALLDYIELFPERLHHPKEDEHLFRVLQRRCAAARPLVAELEAEHTQGDTLIRTLRAALADYVRDSDSAFESFAAAVDAYAAFHWQHMAKEEDVLLPLAQRYLAPQDWQRIHEAFRVNDNPLAGLAPKAHAESLFRRILELVPARAVVRADGSPA